MSKKEENKIDKKENRNMNEYIEIMMKFMNSQIEMNQYRIKQFKEWDESDCDCGKCEDNQVSISDDKKPSFPKDFEEEWA
tara:strand:+ start:152 stop:391 length:240 start_codon:yes stop_codon:yes gene_type:complete